MLVLKTLMQKHGIEQTEVATAAAVSQPAISQLINHGIWPKRRTREVRNNIVSFLASRGLEQEARRAFDEVEVLTANTASTPVPQQANEGDITMLLSKQTLDPSTKKHFGIFRDPFAEEAMQGSDDVFTTPDIRYVREALYQTARFGGFLAVIGESGAGKSTLRRDLVERINRDRDPVIVIEPYVLAMEDNDVKGKTLKAAAIAEAIVSTLAPLESIKRSQDARFRQLHKVLKESCGAGYSHVLVIEEAHSLPTPTLKHLKRFFELENGFKKLLSIVLIGQPELAIKLSERNMEVREVVQRCEVVSMPPLEQDLEGFLRFKFQRVGKNMAEVLDDSAVDAIRARLSLRSGNGKGVISLLYPLAVCNLTIAAMNEAAKLGMPVINGDVIKDIGKQGTA
ncbi:AAA family ATPase [Klebsiella quasipneumoniae]|uniref:ExeA family protein n=1 Tax=Klebsiella quasipneumoniae TaxID=1463165 RepID=UPI00244CA1C8|nr:AAA family ATPase [Klebsiella quasipneumoniae]MDH1962344.1 AAA family ATPase [Klebsiella quasipneumoniae]